jgi:hypothetical protein
MDRVTLLAIGGVTCDIMPDNSLPQDQRSWFWPELGICTHWTKAHVPFLSLLSWLAANRRLEHSKWRFPEFGL